MTLYASIVLFHVACGAVALAAFWSAALARKGGRVHRGAGKAFLLAMCAVLVTGVPLVAQRLADGHPVAAFFLGYLFLITGQACWSSWRAVRDKADWRRLVSRPAWRAWMWGCLAGGAAGLVLGVRTGQPVILLMSCIGPLIALSMWRFARRGPVRANWHVVEHYQGMLGAGVAVHVSFLNIGLKPLWAWLRVAWPALPPALVEVTPWALPLLVATIAAGMLGRRYKRPRRAAAAAPAARA